ncbi:outer membrane protein assembly factor BamB family protein [Paenibacillus sp. TSA_86.1]|uniref:outer membrane protein assembly factor BamB family protein n=1 Tax=Paenibacillus sp. TSA_86.1 TaxID=3415649 RepID=UPI004045D912
MLFKMNHRTFLTRKTRKLQPVIAGLTAGVLMLQCAVVVLPSQAYAEQADISARNWYAGQNMQLPELKPSWTAKVDNYLNMSEQFMGSNAVAKDGKIYTFRDSKLIALDAKTGKVLWTYGSKLKPTIAYLDGVLYGLSGSHKPYALNAKTGKVTWQSSITISSDTDPYTQAVVPTKNTLYVIYGSQTYALNIESGKLRWKANEAAGEGNGTEYLIESGDVVLRSFMVQGALTSIQLNAYDQKTGKKLWDKFGQGEAIQIKNGLVYSVDYHSPLLEDYESSPVRTWTINVYNLKSGALKGSQQYSWELPGQAPYANGRGVITAFEGKLYMEQDGKIAEYALDQYKSGAAPLRTFLKPYGDNMEMLGVAQQRLILRNPANGELAGVKLANGQNVSWNGDAPVSQIDVYGKGMYRAQRNGTLLAINMVTGQPVFRVKAGGDMYNQTLKTGDMIIIQSEGKITGVKLPASLK